MLKIIKDFLRLACLATVMICVSIVVIRLIEYEEAKREIQIQKNEIENAMSSLGIDEGRKEIHNINDDSNTGSRADMKSEKDMESLKDFKVSSYATVLDHLRKEYNNEEIKGILTLPDFDIKFLVVQGDDNEKYLYHGVDNKPVSDGSIFIDSRNTDDDRNIIVYGHNMKSGNMFSPLTRYAEDPDFLASAQKTFTFMNDKDMEEYKIIAIASVTENLENFKPQSELHEIKDIISQSFIDLPSEEIDENDRFMTLTTCIDSLGLNRYLILGKRI